MASPWRSFGAYSIGQVVGICVGFLVYGIVVAMCAFSLEDGWAYSVGQVVVILGGFLAYGIVVARCGFSREEFWAYSIGQVVVIFGLFFLALLIGCVGHGGSSRSYVTSPWRGFGGAYTIGQVVVIFVGFLVYGIVVAMGWVMLIL